MDDYIKRLKELYIDKSISLAIVPKNTNYAYNLLLDVEIIKLALSKLLS